LLQKAGYRCLLPRGVDNLCTAGRAASFSHIAASSCRLCRTMMTPGQGAGVLTDEEATGSLGAATTSPKPPKPTPPAPSVAGLPGVGRLAGGAGEFHPP